MTEHDRSAQHTLIDGSSEPPAEVHLTWRNVEYSVKLARGLAAGRRGGGTAPADPPGRRKILRGVSGEARPGELIGILGGVGAGKSTLLRILAGRVSRGRVSGEILANGQPRPASWRRVIGYVGREEALYRTLTVWETIDFAAAMRLSRAETGGRAGRRARVEEIVRRLGLTGCKSTLVGDALHRGVSGGERKRTEIGIELVTDPRLLLLDEPVSGLDAFTAFYIVEGLREMARSDARTIILSVHRPRSNILAMFDRLLLLSGGQTVFFGPVGAALQHFSRLGLGSPAQAENPADFLLDLIAVPTERSLEARRAREERRARLVAAWAAIEPPVEPPVEPGPMLKRAVKAGRPNTWLHEFRHLTVRNFRTQFRDLTSLISMMAQVIVIGLLLAFIFFQINNDFAGIQNRIGLLFFVPINIAFTMVMPLVAVMAMDRAVVCRERYASTYRVSAFFASKFVSLLPVRLLLNTIFSFIIYYITGLRTDGFGHFLVFLLLVLLLTLTTVAMGLAVGAAVPTVEIGQIVGPLFIVIFLIFGGNLANAATVTWILRWIQYVSFVFYTYQGLVQNEFSGNTFDGISGNVLLERYGLRQIPWYYDAMALVGLMLVFLGLGYWALRVTTRPARGPSSA